MSTKIEFTSKPTLNFLRFRELEEGKWYQNKRAEVVYRILEREMEGGSSEYAKYKFKAVVFSFNSIDIIYFEGYGSDSSQLIKAEGELHITF